MLRGLLRLIATVIVIAAIIGWFPAWGANVPQPVVVYEATPGALQFGKGNATGALTIPSGTTGQAPGSPIEGQIRDDTTVHNVVAYLNSVWVTLFSMNPTLTGSSGTATSISVANTVNQSSTAGYTSFKVNTTETATGSGTKLLFDMQVGGSSKFNVSDNGTVINTAQYVCNGSGRELVLNNNGNIAAGVTGGVYWVSDNNAGGTAFDTGLSRGAAAELDIGNGTQGNKSGTIKAASETLTTALTLSAANLITDTTTGTIIATGTTQKLGFFNATPVVQQTGDALTALSNLGLVASPTLAASDLPTATTGAKGVMQVGTGLAVSSGAVSNSSVFYIGFDDSLTTSPSTSAAYFHKVGNASTVDNLICSSMTQTCSTAPTFAMLECGSSTTCASPTTIGSIQVTSANTAFSATISNAAIAAGDYVAFKETAGTCTVAVFSCRAQVHAN